MIVVVVAVIINALCKSIRTSLVVSELNKAVICTSLGIHNLVYVGQSWLDTALENHKKSVLAGVRG